MNFIKRSVLIYTSIVCIAFLFGGDLQASESSSSKRTTLDEVNKLDQHNSPNPSGSLDINSSNSRLNPSLLEQNQRIKIAPKVDLKKLEEMKKERDWMVEGLKERHRELQRQMIEQESRTSAVLEQYMEDQKSRYDSSAYNGGFGKENKFQSSLSLQNSSVQGLAWEKLNQEKPKETSQAWGTRDPAKFGSQGYAAYDRIENKSNLETIDFYQGSIDNKHLGAADTEESNLRPILGPAPSALGKKQTPYALSLNRAPSAFGDLNSPLSSGLPGFKKIDSAPEGFLSAEQRLRNRETNNPTVGLITEYKPWEPGSLETLNAPRKATLKRELRSAVPDPSKLDFSDF